MPRYRITISAHSQEAMADLIRKHGINVFDHTRRSLKGGPYAVDALADDAQIRMLEAQGYKVERHEDVDEAGKLRQQEIGRENRYQRQPDQEESMLAYLNVDEVEAALVVASSPPNNSFSQLISLPHKTWEGRSVNALKIGNATGPERLGVYLLGGIHSREWGSPDILIFFIEQLAQAYRTKSGLTLGGKTFTAAQIQTIVNTLDIFILPQANPDGRHFSMTGDAMWRKNRRPAPSGHEGNPNCVGVDINRNYDFLWDYPVYFNPQAPIANSTDPCDYQVYIGPAAVSEPETQNVVYLMETFPQIRFFVDIHSYGEDILYSWGDDNDQSTNPAMNFQNPAFNGLRGITDDTAYLEYIESREKELSIDLANDMKSAIEAVRGRTYTVEQAFSLYPTAGTSDDYGYSRHIVDSSKSRMISFVVEWGSPDNPTPFHPPYREMHHIIQEITAGLLAFCLGIIARPAGRLAEGEGSQAFP